MRFRAAKYDFFLVTSLLFVLRTSNEFSIIILTPPVSVMVTEAVGMLGGGWHALYAIQSIRPCGLLPKVRILILYVCMDLPVKHHTYAITILSDSLYNI